MSAVDDAKVARQAALVSYGILDTPAETDFDDLVKIAADVCEAPMALVNLVAQDRQFRKAELGLDTARMPDRIAFCDYAVEAGPLLEVHDALVDPRFAQDPDIVAAGFRFYAGAVLTSPGGHALGTICVLDTVPRSLSEHQIRTLRMLARTAVAQLEMRRLIAERDASIEELREANRRRAVLTRELSHRMKNTLAVVQSIVGQSFRTASSLENARNAVASRLSALARAQDLLTGSVSTSTSIADTVEAALVPHRDKDERIRVDGPQAFLNEQQTMGLTLAIHELATNAWKYGSLSAAGGHVSIGWTAAEDGVFTFRWAEIGGPSVSAPERRGFGTRLLQRIVASYFGGTAQLSFEPTGLVFELAGRLEEIVPAGDQAAASASNSS